ncbi:TasA family protein [Ferdinandcohnia sp. Marseille-Q9671]
MKLIKTYILLMLCIVTLSTIYLPINETSATPTDLKVNISTNPSNRFIDIENMAPGDIVSKILEVNNKGNIDFNYYVSAIKESGDQRLFEQLWIKITNNNEEIYNGKLIELHEWDIGKILSLKGETLQFLFELPLDSSNESQGKSTKVKFNFVANGLVSENNEVLPDTATNISNYLAMGIAFIIGGVAIMVFLKRKKIENKKMTLI